MLHNGTLLVHLVQESSHGDGFLFCKGDAVEETGKERRITVDAIIVSMLIEMKTTVTEKVEIIIQVA